MFSIFRKEEERQGEASLLDRLKQSVAKTRSQIAAKVEGLISGEKRIDPAQLSKLETALLAADLGPKTTRQILEVVRQRLERHALTNATDLKAELKNQLLLALREIPAACHFCDWSKRHGQDNHDRKTCLPFAPRGPQRCPCGGRYVPRGGHR